MEELYSLRQKKEKELNEINKEIYFFEIMEEQNKIKSKIIFSNIINIFDILYLSQVGSRKRMSDDWFLRFLSYVTHYELKDKLDFNETFSKLINLYYDYTKYIDIEKEYENAKNFHLEKVLVTNFRPKI